jgi:fused signal recognition particle receptor
MFGFLKDKLKKAISKFTSDVKEEVDEKIEIKEDKPEITKESPKKDTIQKKEDKIERKVEKKEEKKHISDSKEKITLQKENTVYIKKEPIEQKTYERKAEIKISHEKPEEEKIHELKKESVKKEHNKEITKEHHAKKENQKYHIKKEEEKETKPTGFFGKLKQTFSGKPEEKTVGKTSIKEPEEEKEEQFTHEKETPLVEEQKEKKGFFDKLSEVVTKKTLTESKFDELFFELEVALLENNVAVEVIEKIKNDLKKTLLSEKVSRLKTELIVAESLKNSIDELFDVPKLDLIKEIKKKKPYVICFVGVNGSGKTTNLAKTANYLQKKGISVVIAACDTFRAAAIQQIEEHANNLNIKLIKHDYGADSAAVAYDAIEHAKAKNKDVVLIDTAGRSHSNSNLMDELQKVIRVSKPDLKIFVGDSLTGNDTVEQATTFNEKVGIDGIILSKVDVDEKGGAAISVSFVTKKPIIFIGTGQRYEDLEEFDKSTIIEKLGF